MSPEQASAAADTEDSNVIATEPRRSGRIAARPAEPEPKKPPKAPRGTVKKRIAEESTVTEAAEASTSKKVKSDLEDDEKEEEGLSSIDIGDTLPSLVLKNEKGEDIQIAELTVEYGLVLFLVPKADTPGCTTQACGYRDIYPDFTSVNYRVYCLSADSSSAQNKWQTKKELPYPLISDPKRVLITALGAGEGGKTKRSHFVFEKGGKLVDKVLPVKPADSPRLALEFIKKNEK